MDRILLSGLMKMELPGRPVLLCDGGFVIWGDDVYLGEDPDFGTLAGFEALSEGVGDEAPAGALTMLPRSTAAAVTLSKPGYQNSRIRLWIAEVDEATGMVVGVPDLQADWQLDRTTLKLGAGTRSLELGCVTRSQRLLARNEGNFLSSAFHSRIYPGERGHDNATGLEANFAWGAASPPRGVAASLTSG
jgi:hypothetical protein